MAVDTRDKRSSVIGINAPLFPNPDGSLATQADRQHVAWCYSGILAGAPADDRYGYLVIDTTIITLSEPTAVMGVSKGTDTEMRTD